MPIVNNFLIEAAEKIGSKAIPEKACFAIAGPIVNNTVKLTNLSWMLDVLHMEPALGISQIRLINDFEAIGYGILGLTDDDMYVLQAGETQPDAPMAVIGAGTGLGECFLVCQGNTAKGRIEGIQEGQLKLLMLLLSSRFGAMLHPQRFANAPEIENRVAELSAEELQNLAVAAFNFSSIQDLVAWLDNLS